MEIGTVDLVYDTIEKKSDNKKEIKLLVCCNNYILLFTINSENLELSISSTN